MAANPSNLPRKLPRQERSRALVTALLDATARVLVEDGFERASTNRIAERAGVSVGSLYQYFPNKAALLRALLERHLEEVRALRPAALDDPALPIRQRIRLAVRWYLDAHAAAPALHQELTDHGREILGSEIVRRFEAEMHRVMRAILAPYAARGELRPRDLTLAAFLVARCMEALTHGAVVHHPELLDAPELAAEMTELIAGYLEGRGA